MYFQFINPTQQLLRNEQSHKEEGRTAARAATTTPF
jgi:hypothetical protein